MDGIATRPLLWVACVATILLFAGCVNSIKNSIPAQCLPAEILGSSRDELVTIDLLQLGQSTPVEHIVGSGDVLGVTIRGILGRGQEVDLDQHYPAKFGDSDSGNFDVPGVGTPMTVNANGMIELPYLSGVSVGGLTVSQAADKIREAYDLEQRLESSQAVINLTVIKPRSIQALVLREDSINKWPIFKLNNATLVTKQGSGKAVDLPIYQNDVLHALTESGGLPGTDADDEVWVLHRSIITRDHGGDLTGEEDTRQLISSLTSPDAPRRGITKIPLKVMPGHLPVISPADVILNPGDIVYIPARDREHFFVGGMLKGQQMFLPRDHELDVLGAIAMASGQAVGPPGTPLFNNRGPGAILPPTRVLILRKTADGKQVTIHVDLKKALNDRHERIPVRAGDIILLQFTPGQLIGNYLPNAFRFGAGVSRGYLSKGNTAAKFSK